MTDLLKGATPPRGPKDAGKRRSVGAGTRGLSTQRGRHHEGQDHRGVPLDVDQARVLLDLAPRDGLLQARAAEAAVVLHRGRDVDRVVEPDAELAPPDDVVLADAAAHHERAKLLRL